MITRNLTNVLAFGLLVSLMATASARAQSDRDTRIDNLKTFTETDRLSRERKKVEEDKNKKAPNKGPSASVKRPQNN